MLYLQQTMSKSNLNVHMVSNHNIQFDGEAAIGPSGMKIEP
jgi:hypothetical protein